jgi:hypothetical protein
MNLSNPLYAMMEDEEMAEEFFIGEQGMAMLPMWDKTEDFVSFTVIICAQGDVTILYDNGKDEEREMSMSVEELTKLMDDA